jgi:hypothetical protein
MSDPIPHRCDGTCPRCDPAARKVILLRGATPQLAAMAAMALPVGEPVAVPPDPPADASPPIPGHPHCTLETSQPNRKARRRAAALARRRR